LEHLAGNCSPSLYKLLLAHFTLWLTQRQIALLSAQSPIQHIDIAMEMLQKAAPEAALLSYHRFDVEILQLRLKEARSGIETAAAARGALVTVQYSLPELSCARSVTTH
jgi:hypothetical protein